MQPTAVGNSIGNSVKKPTVNRRAKTNGSRLRLITVHEYEQMIAAGIYTTNDKIELLDGVLIKKMPKNVPHSSAVRRANYFFINRFGNLAVVITQDVVITNENSAPEPDLALLKPPAEKYDRAQPRAADVLLIMEISDSTLAFDRREKSLNYARAGIEQFLIVNLKKREIEDYREPAPDGYRFKKTYTENESFSLAAFPEIEIAVNEFLPPETTETDDEQS